MRSLIAGLIAFGAAVAFANQAPVVDVSAGTDSPSTGVPIHLIGLAEDDATGFDDLVFRWKVRSGPGKVEWGDSTANTTTATFAVPGSYLLELEAFDGALRGRDTLRLQVKERLAFAVLAPGPGKPVPVGKTFTIRWQMDPSIPCVVSLSVDGGKTWETLNGNGAVSDSFAWKVEARRVPGSSARLKVQEYQNIENFALADFTFASSPGASIERRRSGTWAAIQAEPFDALGRTGAHGSRAETSIPGRMPTYHR